MRHHVTSAAAKIMTTDSAQRGVIQSPRTPTPAMALRVEMENNAQIVIYPTQEFVHVVGVVNMGTFHRIAWLSIGARV